MKIVKNISFASGGLFRRVLLFALLVVFITLIVLIFFLNTILQDVLEDQIGKKALALSKTISLMPQIVNLVEIDDRMGQLQPIVEGIKKEIDAEFIVIGDANSMRLTHPKVDRIGEKMVGGDNDGALKEGRYYISKATGTLGPSIRGKSPIFNNQGEIIGIVSVGYLEKNVRQIVQKHYQTIMGYTYIAVICIIFLALFFAKGIKGSLLGFEPKEISQLYLEKEAILNSVQEAIIATNKKGDITLFNSVAKSYFTLESSRPSLPQEFLKFILTCKEIRDVNIEYNGIEYICNFSPIKEANQISGVVLSCRKKEEMDALVWELTRVRQYSEKLREKKHEFSNLLHLVSGYIQTNQCDKALELISSEINPDNGYLSSLKEQLLDPLVTSILIGKYYYAHEKGVDLIVDENSSLQAPLSPEISKHILTILGNLINNAIDASAGKSRAEVRIFITDIGNDIIFDIEDSGGGIDPKIESKIFEKGFSTKGELHSGYGLYFVKNLLEQLGGFISINQGKNGAIISVHIPKGEL